MSKFVRRAVGVPLTMAVAGATIIGCSTGSKSSPATPSSTASSSAGHTPGSTSASAQPSDYTRLLIAAGDIDAPEVFTATPPINNPNGQPGASTTFSNNDRTHVIADSIQILSDPAAALSALESAKSTRDGLSTAHPSRSRSAPGAARFRDPRPTGPKG